MAATSVFAGNCVFKAAPSDPRAVISHTLVSLDLAN
jgi:hypothetical protein